jgi:hypothetical protein
MSLTYSMANYVLKEDFEKFLGTISTIYLKKLSYQGAITWQKRCIQAELKKRVDTNENLNTYEYMNVSNTSASDQLTNILATQTWF